MSRTYKKISELIDEISMGPFGSDIKVEYFEKQGVPVLNGSNIAEVKLKDGFTNFVSHERAKGYKKAVAKRGDIVITHRGTLGQIAYVPDDSEYEEYVISQSQFRVRLKTELINPIYFAYYFHTNEGQKRLLSFKSHVGVPALAQATTNFRLLDFPIRPKGEQDAIANVLESIDKKIELNNRINAELEAMAKTLYDYWFVQFNFPDASGKPYKSSGGKMVYNPNLKREMPEGWAVVPLRKLVNLVKGNVSPSDIDPSTPYIGLEHIQRKKLALEDWALSEAAESDKTVFKKGDILFGKIRPYFHKVTVAPFDGITSTDTLIFRPSSKNYFGVALEVIFSEEFVALASQSSTGSKMPRADWNVLKKYPVAIPEDDLLDRFQVQIEQVLIHLNLTTLENRELRELRDWLLPMLMNGQVTVTSSTQPKAEEA